MSESNTVTPEVEPAIPPPPPIEGAPPPPPPPILVPVPVDFQARRVRPLLGPGLWIFGMLLWAHVVFGTFVIGKDMPEAYALLAVLIASTTAWLLAVKARQDTRQLALRHFAPVGVALSFWGGAMLFALLCAAALGGMGVGYLLGIVAFVAILLGRRFAGPPRKPATRLRKALYVLLWMMAAFTTFIAAVMHSSM